MKFQTLFLLGATATGKTKLAIEWASRYPIEIISVDSTMVYRGLNIGTGKPKEKILSKIPHHLINLCDPTKIYSVALFIKDAFNAIKIIRNRGRIPLLVGGSMMYFKYLLKGLSDLPIANYSIRKKILEEGEKNGWKIMHKKLKRIDPESYSRINFNDKKRIQRALEVYSITGCSISQIWKNKKGICYPYSYKILGIPVEDRVLLHKSISIRFHNMLKAGFLEEAENLYRRYDLHESLPSMQSVGYKQAWQVFSGKLPLKYLSEKSIIATRQLAKRQLSWLRKWKNIYWIKKRNDINLYI